MERTFFEQVLDVFEGAAVGIGGELHSYAHPRGLKVWFGDATREHYEAQLIRVDGNVKLEIGFHAEHPKPALNDAALQRLQATAHVWRPQLGEEPEAGAFIGAQKWRRISELWEPPDHGDLDAAIEVGARLGDYVLALEPLRRA